MQIARIVTWKKALAVASLLWAGVVAAAVDVNKATEAELDGVKGLGPVTTQQILAERKNAAFKDWNDLIARVKGIGQTRAARLSSEGLTVSGAAFKPVAATGKAEGSKK